MLSKKLQHFDFIHDMFVHDVCSPGFLHKRKESKFQRYKNHLILISYNIILITNKVIIYFSHVYDMSHVIQYCETHIKNINCLYMTPMKLYSLNY